MLRGRAIVGALALVSSMVMAGVGTTGAAGPGSDTARVCQPVSGAASCNAIQLLNPGVNWAGTHATPATGSGGRPGVGTTFTGYTPQDLWSAYNLGSSVGAYVHAKNPPTVAVVDAYNDPNAASDLATYRSAMGLPACNTSTGAGCVTVINGDGGSSLPRSDIGWSEEISLDLDMVSAICPYCRILLSEANSASYADLGTAVDTAASTSGVVAISNSYGGSESSNEATSYDPYYAHSGIAVTASAGDSGYGVEYPAASPYVVAVGGTTLNQTHSGWSQTVWSGTGSGCSAYEPIPSWQPSVRGTCTMRTVGDVAAVADPKTGVAVYDSFREPGWMVFGGTSVASPIVASIFALAGNTSGFSTSSGASTAAQAFYVASKGARGSYPLVPVTSGSNGSCGNYLCNAADSLSTGYNGPTGMGTPNGTAGF